jgi:uncharacterized membrane protein
VSAGSALLFPKSWIYFGVLHGLAVMLALTHWMQPIVQRRFASSSGAPLCWLLMGSLALLLPQFIQHPFFDHPWMNWVGLVTHKPRTEDFVPLLPWMGVFWLGLGFGAWLPALPPQTIFTPKPLKILATFGRYSLSFYMLHQLFLIGLLMLWRLYSTGF